MPRANGIPLKSGLKDVRNGKGQACAADGSEITAAVIGLPQPWFIFGSQRTCQQSDEHGAGEQYKYVEEWR